MQPNKSTNKIEQINKVSQNEERISANIADMLAKFNTKSIFTKVNNAKRCGILLSSIADALLILPFIGAASVCAMFKSGLDKPLGGKKDAYYAAKNNEKINWRMLISLFAKRFVYLTSLDGHMITETKNMLKQIKAIIFDDSLLDKSGKHIEGIGMVHDHVTNLHVLGYKLLVCGFWDGRSFIPLDFSLHREKRGKDLENATKRVNVMGSRIEKKENEIRALDGKKKIKKKELSHTKIGSQKQKQKQRVIAKIDDSLAKKRKDLRELKKRMEILECKLYDAKANYKCCGLASKEHRNQFKKKRELGTSGLKRKKELDDNKIDIAIRMLCRSVGMGFVPDYVLTDTWFFCHKLLKAVIETGRTVNLVSMAQMGKAKYELLPTGKFLNPKEIVVRYERTEGKWNRQYKSRYIKVKANYMGIRVNLFLVKMGRQKNWRMLVTTDLSLSFPKLIEIYKIRWTIEVFFKECKQNLYLGKCQSTDFDAQIADTSLSLIRYIMLSYYERLHYGVTIGGLFRELSMSAVKENLLTQINIYFMDLLEVFADFAEMDVMDLYGYLLQNPKAAKILETLGNPIKPEAA